MVEYVRGVTMPVTRTRFKIIALLAVVVLSFAALLLTGSTSASADPDHITLTWTDDARTTQTITWETEFTTATGMIQYIEADKASSFPQNARCATAAVEGLETNVGNISIHSATLIGLKPGTRYLYRVGDGSNWSKQSSFTTAAEPSQPFKFLVFGDSQSTNYLAWRTTLHTAYQANRDASFLINVGDLVDVGQDYNEWNAWFSAARGVIETIPVMPVVGNHETYTPQRKYSMPEFFTTQFKVPANGPEGLNGQVYSFDYGNAHFSVLDSQAGEEREFMPQMLDLQKVWLEQDLKATSKLWKIVLIHRPLYHNRPKGGDEDLRDAFVPILDKYHVDVVFSGHDHVYARSYPLYDGAAVESPKAGTIYVTSGRSGTKAYPGASARQYNEVFHNPVDEPNYITVEVSGSIMTVKAFQRSGFLIDEWSIVK